MGYRYVKVDLIPRDVAEGGWFGVEYRYVEVDLIHSGVEEGGGVGWGRVQVCEGRFDS